MNMYVVFALFFVSSAVILACLDHLKMRHAINLFLVLCVVLVLYIPLAIWGNDIVAFCEQNESENLLQSVLAIANRAIPLSNLAFSSVTFFLAVLAVISAISAVIVVVHTAKAICKLVQSLTNKRQYPKLPQKQTYQRKLVHSKIQYKRILYLRFCRLIS